MMRERMAKTPAITDFLAWIFSSNARQVISPTRMAANMSVVLEETCGAAWEVEAASIENIEV